VFDEMVIHKRLVRLETVLRKFRTLSECSEREYLEKEPLQDQAERNLQIAIQVCIDIASHLVASFGFRSPENYGDIFVVLREEGLIGGEVCTIMRNMAGLRNILVHGYLDIKPHLIYQQLQSLDDFCQFAEAIACIMQQCED